MRERNMVRGSVGFQYPQQQQQPPLSSSPMLLPPPTTTLPPVVEAYPGVEASHECKAALHLLSAHLSERDQ
eukprot:4544542-Amphidinium_carterae.1